MEKILRKKLVYNMYVYDGIFDLPLQQMHMRCLSKYINIFDDVLFCINVDNLKNSGELIKDVENRIISLTTGIQNVSFKIVENNDLRESKTFYDEVIQKLGEDDYVFFAHNKGITNNEDDIMRNSVRHWIVGMYYFCLNYMKEVEYYLCDKDGGICYGAFLTFFDKYFDMRINLNRYHWCYPGTFFWINSKRLKNYINDNDIVVEIMSDRFYAENFLGSICRADSSELVTSHLRYNLINAGDFYHSCESYINTLYGDCDEDINGYRNLYNEVTEGLFNDCI